MEYAGGIASANRLAEETRVFGVAQAQREQVDVLIENFRRAFYRMQLMGRLSPGVYQSAISLMLVFGLAILSHVGAGHVPSLGAVIVLLYRAGQSGQAVQGSWQNLRQSVPFIERLEETRRRYDASCPPEGEEPLAGIRALAFDEVSFAYRPGRPVLSEVSFEVAGGETVGVIGPSGAGKSTLIQILLRLREPGEGRYLVNGSPAQEFRFEDWHRLVAYVPQEPRLVHTSVTENIRFFRDITTRRSSEPRGSPAFTMTSRAGRRDTGRSWARARTRSPAASSSASALRGRSPGAPRCSCSTSPPARSTRNRRRSSRSRSPACAKSSRCSSSPTACQRLTSVAA